MKAQPEVIRKEINDLRLTGRTLLNHFREKTAGNIELHYSSKKRDYSLSILKSFFKTIFIEKKSHTFLHACFSMQLSTLSHNCLPCMRQAPPLIAFMKNNKTMNDIIAMVKLKTDIQ